jgi:hypothetical protein
MCASDRDEDTLRADSTLPQPEPLQLAELSPDDATMEAYHERLLWLLEHPLDLNTADESALAALPGMSPDDARLVIRWRSRGGRFNGVEQLRRRGVDGVRLYHVLAPFVSVTATNVFQVRLRSRFLRKLPGQTPGAADEIEQSGVREYHRLMVKRGDAMTGELTVLREPGQTYREAFVTGSVGFGWTGAFIEHVVAGDLSAGCAQGLVFGRAGTGMSDGPRGWGWSGPLQLEPFHGTSGTRVIRGVGASTRLRSAAGVLSFGGFAGRTPFAASLDEDGNITSLSLRPDPGQGADATHPVVHEWSTGGHVAWISPAGPAAGVSFLWSQLSRPFAGDVRFGDVQAVRIIGVDLSMITGRASIAAEGAWMKEGHAVAGRLGLALDPQTVLSVGAWYASPGYRNRKGGQGVTGGDMVNDAGVAIRWECAPVTGMTCSGAVTRHGRLWRTTFDHLPPEGNELSLRITQQVSRPLTVSLSLRSSTTESWERWDGPTLLPHSGSVPSVRRSYLLSFDHSVSRAVRLQTRIGHVHTSAADPGSGEEDGWMMGNDLHVVFAPGTTIDVRWENFMTDSYSSRVYLIERDVDGAYAAPPMYGRGIRWYALFRTAIVHGLNLSVRYAVTHHDIRLRLRADGPALTFQCDADPASILPSF